MPSAGDTFKIYAIFVLTYSQFAIAWHAYANYEAKEFINQRI